MIAVLISVRPQWCRKIAERHKEIEVRKNKPKLKTPFKCYIYCTAGTGKNTFNIPITTEQLLADVARNGMKSMNCEVGNGKVWAECVCDHIFQYTTMADKDGTDISDADMVRLSCLDHAALFRYENSAPFRENVIAHFGLYGWHISELLIYEKPMVLREMRFTNTTTIPSRSILYPPQGWCYVEVTV